MCTSCGTATGAVTAPVTRPQCGLEGRLGRFQRREVADPADLGPVGREHRGKGHLGDDVPGELPGERGDDDVIGGSQPEEGGVRGRTRVGGARRGSGGGGDIDLCGLCGRGRDVVVQKQCGGEDEEPSFVGSAARPSSVRLGGGFQRRAVVTPGARAALALVGLAGAAPAGSAGSCGRPGRQYGIAPGSGGDV